MEQSQIETSEKTAPPKKFMDNLPTSKSKSSEHCTVKVRRNNVTTRISARPPHIGQATRSSSSPSSEFRCDESSASPSICTSTTPISGTTVLASDRTEDSSNGRPNYMNLTESTKAKQKRSNYLHHRSQRQQSMDEFQFLQRMAGGFSNVDSKNTADSDLSINFSRPLYLPTYLDKASVKPR